MSNPEFPPKTTENFSSHNSIGEVLRNKQRNLPQQAVLYVSAPAAVATAVALGVSLTLLFGAAGFFNLGKLPSSRL